MSRLKAVAWTPDAPRFPLLGGASPLHPLVRFTDALRAGGQGDVPEIWIKREDLLPLAFGGNKLRNLEFHVGAALARGADTLVTSGRRWSNHCRLTAAAGARAGLAVELVLSGPPAPVPGPNERLDELLGATVHVTATGERAEREVTVAAIVERLAEEGRRPYLVPVGGSGAVGVIGQALAGLELAAQLAALRRAADSVVLPTATGGTQAGILVGLRLAGLTTRVLGMAVASPAAELSPTVTRLAREVATLADPAGAAGAFARRDWAAEVEIDDGALGDGYGRRGHLRASARRRRADARLSRRAGSPMAEGRGWYHTPPHQCAPRSTLFVNPRLSPKPIDLDAPLKHVIDVYKHRDQTVTCVCGWHGSSATADGGASPWTSHLVEMRGKKR